MNGRAGVTPDRQVSTTRSAVLILGLLRTDSQVALPAILALTGCHFLIDLWKNILSSLRPHWVTFSYLQDQALHLLSIAFAGWSLWGLLILFGGLAYHWLDLAGPYRLRALATDGCVVAVVMSAFSW